MPPAILNHIVDFEAVERHLTHQETPWNLAVPAPVQGDWFASIAAQSRSLKRFREAVDRTIQGENIHFDQSDRTVFGIRLLQIFLWQAGHYFGDLDGLWGPASDAALHRAALVRPAGENGDANPLDGIMEERSGIIRILLPETLRHCGEWQAPVFRARASDDPASSADDLGRLQVAIREGIEEIGGWHQATTGEIAKQEAMAWNRLFEEVDTGPVASGLGAVRSNYGMRSLASGVDWLIDKLQDIVRKVKEKVASFFKRVAKFVDDLIPAITGAALQAFRLLKRGLTGAIRVAALAGRRVLRMIRGEPFATISSSDRWILTRFSFDQDAVGFCSHAVTLEDVSGHFQEIARENQALATTLVLGVRVLKILVACAPPVAGLVAIRLAIDIFRLLCRAPSLLHPASPATKGLRSAALSPGLVPAPQLPPLGYLTA